MLDLDSLAFDQGAHLMSNKKCELPKGSYRAQKKGYDEVHVPAVEAVPVEGEKQVPISDLPEWAQSAFKGMTTLNRVQSKMYDAAFYSPENLLLCAPTSVTPPAAASHDVLLCLLNTEHGPGLGANLPSSSVVQAGKTNVAMLTILHEIGLHLDKTSGEIDFSAFKIVYIAPMKALVQEVVQSFSKRL